MCVCVRVCVGGEGGGGGSLCICPPSDRQATSPLVLGHGCFNSLNWWTFRPTPRNFEMAIISPSNGCNDLYPLEFAVQLLNGTRGDRLDTRYC